MSIMKTLKQMAFFSLISVVMMSFSQCASTQKLEGKSPVEFKEVYYKTWSNPARYTGSGINVYLLTTSENNDINLDSVYFRKQQVKLIQTKPNSYVGKFKTATNQPHDIVMSSDPKEEYGNTLPEIKKPIPFELKDNECVISYKEGKATKYFKISNITKKQNNTSLNQRM